MIFEKVRINHLQTAVTIIAGIIALIFIFLGWVYITKIIPVRSTDSLIRPYHTVSPLHPEPYPLFSNVAGIVPPPAEEKRRLEQLIFEASNKEFIDNIFNVVDEKSFTEWLIYSIAVSGQNKRSGYLRYDGEKKRFMADINFDFAFDITSVSAESRVFAVSEDPLVLRLFANQSFVEQFLNNLSKKINKNKEREKIIQLVREKNQWAKESAAAFLVNNLDRLQSFFAAPSVKYILSQKVNATSPFLEISSYSLSPLQIKKIEIKFVEPAKSLAEYLTIDGKRACIRQSAAALGSEPTAVFICNLSSWLPQVDLFIPQFTKEPYPYTLLRLKEQKHKIHFPGGNVLDIANVKEISVETINEYDGKKILGVDTMLVDEREFANLEDIAKKPDDFVREHPAFRLGGNNSIVLASAHNIFNKNIVIPKNTTLIIPPGTSINMLGNASFVSYSPVIAKGTSSQPIIIRGDDDSKGNNFVILDNKGLSVIEYVHFSGGGESTVNGAFFSGMLAIQHADSVVRHNLFKNARGDDAVNIKFASSTVAYNIFENNSADALDYDFSDGVIEHNQFLKNGNDGIDTSGSPVLVRFNYINGSGDKCISIGEKSSPKIFNNVLNGCHIGIETKDSSQPTIVNNVLVNNDIALNAYRKKGIFRGGSGAVYNSIIWNNKKEIVVDDLSNYVISNSMVENGYPGSNNFSHKPYFKNELNKDFTNNPDHAIINFLEGGSKEVLLEKFGVDVPSAPVGLLAPLVFVPN